jgi:hypothetical protein
MFTSLYIHIVFYNYGEPGHHKASCLKPAVYGNSTVHKKDTCPVKKLPSPSAKLVGSANPRLIFFHVELPPPLAQGLQITENVGIVYVEAGEISKEDLASEFSMIYKTTWPWQIRDLDDWTYLVKFPPHMVVADVASYPCLNVEV